MINLYPVQPPRWFNKKVWLPEKARSDPQKVIGPTILMNSSTVQQVGAKLDPTFQPRFPIQSLTQFEVKILSRSHFRATAEAGAAESNRFSLALARA